MRGHPTPSLTFCTEMGLSQGDFQTQAVRPWAVPEPKGVSQLRRCQQPQAARLCRGCALRSCTAPVAVPSPIAEDVLKADNDHLQYSLLGKCRASGVQLGKTTAKEMVGVAELRGPGLVPAWQRMPGSPTHPGVLVASRGP